MKFYILFLLFTLVPIRGGAEPPAETLVLVCDVKVLSLVSHTSKDIAEYEIVNEKPSTLIIDFKESQVTFMGKTYFNYNVIRDNHGIIIAGPLEKFVERDGSEVVELMNSRMSVDPYTGEISFTPEKGKWDSKNGGYIKEVGSITYRGICDKPSPPKF